MRRPSRKCLMNKLPWRPPTWQAPDEITQRLGRIEHKLEAIMSGLTDLNASIAQQGTDFDTLKTVVGTLIADLQAALANSDSDAAVEAASQIVAQQDAALQALTAQVQGADPGAPADPGTPAPAAPPAA